ncbi:hypothetical protein [Hymenobacter sp.]|uniref:hypothetical protein n=1 Tax=Hymenobacter sp. TaxID=1898978 RepID=UPI002EDB8293
MSAARACSCVSGGGSEKQKIAAAYRQGALIFVGQVVSVETVVTTDTVRVSDTGPIEQRTRLIKHETLRYTFAVSRQLKGQLSGSTVLISTETQSSSCGKQFKIGSEQLVYAFLVSQEASLLGGEPKSVAPYYATSLCERNQELKYVKAAELRQLNQLGKAG